MIIPAAASIVSCASTGTLRRGVLFPPGALRHTS